jgi:hypothetical protein
MKKRIVLTARVCIEVESDDWKDLMDEFEEDADATQAVIDDFEANLDGFELSPGRVISVASDLASG